MDLSFPLSERNPKKIERNPKQIKEEIQKTYREQERELVIYIANGS